VTLYIVRHAVAVAKNRWNGDDLARPLTVKGVEQAAAFTAWLEGPPAVIVSSPTVRCVATVLGAAERHEVDLRTCRALLVGRSEQALELARRLLDEFGPPDAPSAVLCSHGEVIPAVMTRLGLVGASDALDSCAKGSVWAVTVTGDGPVGRYTAFAGRPARRRDAAVAG
jgi:8-oxo-(d)GTP phosphatase